jgi:hypothetical protein
MTEQIIVDTRLININSTNSIKLNDYYYSNVLLQFQNLLKEEDDILYTTCGLLSAQIPFSFYNINVNNQTLKYSVNSVVYSLTIPEGNYNSTTFITAFQTQFSAGGHGKTIVITIDKLTGRLTITVSSYSLIVYSTDSSMYRVLGIIANTDISVSSSTTLSFPLNLLGVKKINITSNALANFNTDSYVMNQNNLVESISVQSSAFGLIVYDRLSNTYGQLRNKIINEIDIQIRDEDYKLIDFNGIDWSLCFQLNITRKIRFTAPIYNFNFLKATTTNDISGNTQKTDEPLAISNDENKSGDEDLDLLMQE